MPSGRIKIGMAAHTLKLSPGNRGDFWPNRVVTYASSRFSNERTCLKE